MEIYSRASLTQDRIEEVEIEEAMVQLGEEIGEEVGAEEAGGSTEEVEEEDGQEEVESIMVDKEDSKMPGREIAMLNQWNIRNMINKGYGKFFMTL